MGFEDLTKTEPEPAISIFRRSNTTVPLSLSLSLNDVSLFASPVYTHVYTPRCPLS